MKHSDLTKGKMVLCESSFSEEVYERLERGIFAVEMYGDVWLM